MKPHRADNGLPIAAIDVWGKGAQQHEQPAQHTGPRAPEQPNRATWAGFVDWLTCPNTWGRPDDTRKTLPAQWAIAQSRWRFLTAIVPWLGPPSHTLSHIFVPLCCVIGVAVGVKLAEGRVAWGLDKTNAYAQLFRMSSFVLSLLLSVRINRTYDRWWTARCAFGGIGGNLVNAVRCMATWTDEPHLLRNFQKWSSCMIYGTIQLLNDTPHKTDPRVAALLEPDELELYESTTKPAKLCGSMLGALVLEARLQPERERAVNDQLALVAANVSQVARIKLQAMPTGLALFCSGYTLAWLLMLPLGVFPEAGWASLVPIAVMACMMLALEDLANQLETPFTFVPYEAMVVTSTKDMARTVREVQAVKQMAQGKYRQRAAALAAAGPAAQAAAAAVVAGLDPPAGAPAAALEGLPPWPLARLGARPQRKP